MCTHVNIYIHMYICVYIHTKFNKNMFSIYDNISEYKIKFLVLEEFTAWIKQAVYWF